MGITFILTPDLNDAQRQALEAARFGLKDLDAIILGPKDMIEPDRVNRDYSYRLRDLPRELPYGVDHPYIVMINWLIQGYRPTWCLINIAGVDYSLGLLYEQ